MNEIRLKRLLLGGLATFVAWIGVSILLEGILGSLLFGDLIEEMWLETSVIGEWSGLNQVLNIALALLNSTLLIWLYASLRPMYGVGARTALIASTLGVIWVWSLTLNLINLGLLPPELGLVEGLYESIEFPIAMLAGAEIYEGKDRRDTEGE